MFTCVCVCVYTIIRLNDNIRYFKIRHYSILIEKFAQFFYNVIISLRINVALIISVYKTAYLRQTTRSMKLYIYIYLTDVNERFFGTMFPLTYA